MASKEATSSYPKIQPHWISKGTDICSDGYYIYIIRSDLKCYMVTRDLHRGTHIAVHALHPACQGGDHYLANSRGFYIIKGDGVRLVQNLTTDKNARVLSLHPNCREGTHYASRYEFGWRSFVASPADPIQVILTPILLPFVLASALDRSFSPVIIVWADPGKVTSVCNLNTGEGNRNDLLASNCKDGLYYWGTPNFRTGKPEYYFLKPVDQWGVTYHSTQNLSNDEGGEDLSVSPDVIPFLPGGLTLTHGPSYGRWELLKSFKNTSNATFKWEKKIKTTVGYKKSELESIERHWDVKISATWGLTESLAKMQLSMEASYGEKTKKTSKEAWTSSAEEEETISVDIPPGETVYIWQYQVGFGSKPILFARNIATTFSSEPPTDNALNTDKK